MALSQNLPEETLSACLTKNLDWLSWKMMAKKCFLGYSQTSKSGHSEKRPHPRADKTLGTDLKSYTYDT